MTDDRQDDQRTAPNQRSFSLNSAEACAALCPRSEAWIPNGGLPREPQLWDAPVIVERGRSRK